MKAPSVSPRVALLLTPRPTGRGTSFAGSPTRQLDLGGWDFFIEPRGYDERIHAPAGLVGRG